MSWCSCLPRKLRNQRVGRHASIPLIGAMAHHPATSRPSIVGRSQVKPWKILMTFRASDAGSGAATDLESG